MKTASRRLVRFSQNLTGITGVATLALAAWAPAAHAQSSYTLNTLSGAFTSDHALRIDTQNRVLGGQTYLVGYEPSPYWFGLPSPIYGQRVAQWAQPFLGGTVSPTYPVGRSGYMTGASPDGNKILLTQVVNSLFDRATKSIQTLPSTLGYVMDVNNAGTVVGTLVVPPVLDVPLPPASENNPDTNKAAMVWTSGAIASLPMGAYTSAGTVALNASGVVVGAVYCAPSRQFTRAARWNNGVLEVLEEQPGRGSLALDVSDAGHVLVKRWDVRIVPSTQPGTGEPYDRIDQINEVYGVFHQGAYAQIVSTIPGYGMVGTARQVNASGAVIGTVLPDAPILNGKAQPPRAFLWQGGQMQDLTALAASKGVKLPAGTVLSVVVALNDQGSLVAGFEHPSTKRQTYVRLQAKP